MLFIVCIVSLGVMLIIGTTFMGISMQQMHDARKEHNALHAIVMADAGVNYMVWKQKYSGDPIPNGDSRILPASTDPRILDRNVTPPCLVLQLGSTNEDRADIWLMEHDKTVSGTRVRGYEVISRGSFRDTMATQYNRSVRAVLQPPPIAAPTTIFSFPQLNNVVFTESDLYVGTSSDVHGDGSNGLACNGSAYLDTSAGGSINASVTAAGAVIFDKNKTRVNGSVKYGTKILDPKGNDITGDAQYYISGTESSGGDTMLLPEMKSDDYAAWANSQGSGAFFTGTSIKTSDVVAKDILYVNPDKTPGYTLNIDCSIPKAAVVFVNGDVVINGSIKLGSVDTNLSDGDSSKPFVIVATGTVTCNGSPEIDGIIWASGAFGRGTPTIYGSVICNNLAGFQGNNKLYFHAYNANVVPDSALNYQHSWRVASWEELR